CMQSVEYPRTF
nr:immunoglobulin light chain junction region [Macaca mulatta]